MISPGVQEVVLSVFDIDRIVRPMVEVCGFDLISLPDAPQGQFTAWRVPPVCSRIEQALCV